LRMSKKKATGLQDSFAKKLASNDLDESTKTIIEVEQEFKRDRDFTEVELMRIWKGLFYAMWMSDKVPVQNALAGRIASLVHSFTPDTLPLFLNTFYATMDTEWGGIDMLRVDKFYTLIRHLLRETFLYIKTHEYNEDLITQCSQVLVEKVFPVMSESNIGYHISDIYMEELNKVVGSDVLPSSTLEKLSIDIFIPAYKAAASAQMKEHIRQVFDHLALAMCKRRVQSPFLHMSAQSCADRFLVAHTEMLGEGSSSLFKKLHTLFTNAIPGQVKAISMPSRPSTENEDAAIRREALAILEAELKIKPLALPVSKKRQKAQQRAQAPATEENTQVGSAGEKNGDQIPQVPLEQGSNEKKKKKKKKKKQSQANGHTKADSEVENGNKHNGNNKKNKQAEVKQTNGHHEASTTTVKPPATNGSLKRKAGALAVAAVKQGENAELPHNNITLTQKKPAPKKPTQAIAENNKNNTETLPTDSDDSKLNNGGEHKRNKRAKVATPPILDNTNTDDHNDMSENNGVESEDAKDDDVKTPPAPRSKSLLKTPNTRGTESGRKNVRFSAEDSVQEFYQEDGIVPEPMVTPRRAAKRRQRQ